MNNRIRICIQDSDREYASKLASQLADADHSFRVLVGESHKEKDYDVLLTDRKITGRKTPHVLLEKPLRYLGVKKLAFEIRLAMIHSGLHEMTAESMDQDYEFTAEQITFVGVEGGAGTSSVALGCARELSRYRDKKVLYLSLEPIVSDRLCVEQHIQTSTLDEFLFEFLNDGKACNEEMLRMFLVKDSYGVMSFAPTGKANRLRELNDATFSQFMSMAAAAAKADYVILDVGCAVDLSYRLLKGKGYNFAYVAAADGLKSWGDDRRVREFCSFDEKELTYFGSNVIVINRHIYSEEEFDEEHNHRKKFDPFRQYKAGIVRDGYLENDDPESGSMYTSNYARAEAWHEEQSKEWTVYIDEDAASFEHTEHGVDISLSNAFGTGIRELVDKLTEQRWYTHETFEEEASEGEYEDE
jgi:hypothetical protein